MTEFVPNESYERTDERTDERTADALPGDDRALVGRVVVISNIKGGTGKSTTAVNIIVGLLRQGRTVASIDLDSDQASLSRYIQHRRRFVETTKLSVGIPDHYGFAPVKDVSARDRDGETRRRLGRLIESLATRNDVVVVDCPGTDDAAHRFAISRADVLITPVNDSFVDLDLIAQMQGTPPEISQLGLLGAIVSREMKVRSEEEDDPLEWIVLRNRLSSAPSRNMQSVKAALENLSGKLGFKLTEGMGERVIFRELFLLGLTILDLRPDEPIVVRSPSHVAAHAEARRLLEIIGLSDKVLRRPRSLHLRRGRSPQQGSLMFPGSSTPAQSGGAARPTDEAPSKPPLQPTGDGGNAALRNGNGAAQEDRDIVITNLPESGQPPPATEAPPPKPPPQAPPRPVVREAPARPIPPGQALARPDANELVIQGPPVKRRNVMVVYNPASGIGHKRRFRTVLRYLARLGCSVTVRETAGPGEAESAALTARMQKFEAVIAAGSDATVGEVVNALAGSMTPMGIMPLGSGGLLAREMGLARDARNLARMIVAGRPMQIYLGTANERRFPVAAAVGIGAWLVGGGRRFSLLRRPLAFFDERTVVYDVSVDGKRYAAAGVVLTNGRCLVGNVPLTKNGGLSRPALYVCMFKKGGRWAMLRYRLAQRFGSLAALPDVEIVPAAVVSVSGPKESVVYADGMGITRLPATFSVGKNRTNIIRSIS